ncbi:MAG: S-layer homology domain-containing protein [Clostridiales bacterium]|nr:S-layer homology domain-containing protein [Clostridiales bacterium]
MKKRFSAFFLALALCVGLTVPAFAADTTPVTAEGISFNAIVTDRYESWKSIAEGYSWADSLGPEAEFLYSIGWQTVREADIDGFGLADFKAYLVDDNVTLDFHVKKGEEFSIDGYYLSVVETNSFGEAYDATFVDGWTFTANEDGELVDKAFIDRYCPGANYLICYHGSYDDFDWNKAVRIVFVDENIVPRTVPGFTDLLSWCDAEALWASWKNITNGYGGKTTFAPNVDCTQAQILTFLWRAEGKPQAAKAPITTAASYQDAINWAYEKEMIDGSFDPDAPCTRSQAVSYIWQALGKPEAKEAASFSDVATDAPYAGAVNWAVEKKVTNGYGGNDTFAPDQVCKRGQIACFLYRAYNN